MYRPYRAWSLGLLYLDTSVQLAYLIAITVELGLNNETENKFIGKLLWQIDSLPTKWGSGDRSYAPGPVKAAIELAANPLADLGLRQSALAIANQHLNAGCSVTVVLLNAMVKAAHGLGAGEIERTFAVQLETLKKEQQLERE